MLDHIEANHSLAYIRSGKYATEIVRNKTSYIFGTKDNKPMKGLFIYNMVRKDAKAFLDSGKKHRLPKKNPVNEINDNFSVKLLLTATDLTDAYWTIAKNVGIISEYTYLKGIQSKEYKTARLAALSTLGKGKEYNIIRNGKQTTETVLVGYDEQLANLYLYIRYTCYKHMQEVKKLLGKGFAGYKTDCIYYKDTKRNRNLVHKYFLKVGIDFVHIEPEKERTP